MGLNHHISNLTLSCHLARYLMAALVPARVVLRERQTGARRYETRLNEFIDFSRLMCCGEPLPVVMEPPKGTPETSLEVTKDTPLEAIEAAAMERTLLILKLSTFDVPVFEAAKKQNRKRYTGPGTGTFCYPPAAEPARIAAAIAEKIGPPYACLHVRRAELLRFPAYRTHTALDEIQKAIDFIGAPKVYIMSDEAAAYFALLRGGKVQVFQYIDFPELRALTDPDRYGGHMLYPVERDLMRRARWRVLTYPQQFLAFEYADRLNDRAAYDYSLIPPHIPPNPRPLFNSRQAHKADAATPSRPEPIVKKIAYKHLVKMTDAYWEKLSMQAEVVLELFRQPGGKSLVRLGDGEMEILQNQHPIASRLAEAVDHADCLGLVGLKTTEISKTTLRALREHYGVEIDTSLLVSAHLFASMPELAGKLAAGKRVLWITSDAQKIVKNIENPAFRDFYGLHDIARNDWINAAAPGWQSAFPKKVSAEQAFEDIKQQLSGKEFDLALVGIGVTGKIICHYIKTTLDKPAADIGVCMSYLKGSRERSQLLPDANRDTDPGINALVWDPAAHRHSDTHD